MIDINKNYNESNLETMAKMPDNFIDLTVTSPPYDDLRIYNGYVDVENFKYFKDRLPFYSRKENESHDAYLIRISERSGFEIGFKKSQKLYSNKQFTLEDMKNCFFNGGNMKDEQDWNLYIHSLQHKEWIVEIEQSNNKIKITKVINKHNKIPN